MIWLLACATTPGFLPGESEDGWGHPRALLADCTETWEAFNGSYGTTTYDAYGYPDSIETFSYPDLTTEDRVNTVDELGRITRWTADQTVFETTYEGDSWRLAHQLRTYDDGREFEWSWSWTETTALLETTGCLDTYELGGGIRFASHLSVCEGTTYADERYRWSEGRLVARSFEGGEVVHDYTDGRRVLSHAGTEDTETIRTWDCP